MSLPDGKPNWAAGAEEGQEGEEDAELLADALASLGAAARTHSQHHSQSAATDTDDGMDMDVDGDIPMPNTASDDAATESDATEEDEPGGGSSNGGGGPMSGNNNTSLNNKPPPAIHARHRPPGSPLDSAVAAAFGSSRADLPPPADPRHLFTMSLSSGSSSGATAGRPVAVPQPRTRRASQPPIFTAAHYQAAASALSTSQPTTQPFLFGSVPNGIGLYSNGHANGNGHHANGHANGNGNGTSSSGGGHHSVQRASSSHHVGSLGNAALFGTSISSVVSIEEIRDLEMSIFGTEIDGTTAQRYTSSSSRGGAGSSSSAAMAPFSLGEWEGEGLEDEPPNSDAETEEEDVDFSEDEELSADENDEDMQMGGGGGGGAMRVRKSPMMMATSSDPARRYICPHAGCGKVYKNPGGLKYHLAHGHAVFKPYKCCVEECGKRYRNAGGLKYHLEHAHYQVFASMRKVNAAGKTKIDLSSCYDPGTKPQSLPQTKADTKSPRARATQPSWGSPPAFPASSSVPTFGKIGKGAIGASPPSGPTTVAGSLNSTSAMPRAGYFPAVPRASSFT